VKWALKALRELKVTSAHKVLKAIKVIKVT
jgi:hypothetical protein